MKSMLEINKKKQKQMLFTIKNLKNMEANPYRMSDGVTQ
jgi:hypothetical protein